MTKPHDSLEVAWLEIAGVAGANERHAGALSERRPAVGALLVFDQNFACNQVRASPINEDAVGRGRDYPTAELDDGSSDAGRVLGQA